MLNLKLRRFDYRKDLEKLYCCMLDEVVFTNVFQLHNIEMFEHWTTEKFIQNKYQVLRMGCYNGQGIFRNDGKGGYGTKGHYHKPDEGGYNSKGYYQLNG